MQPKIACIQRLNTQMVNWLARALSAIGLLNGAPALRAGGEMFRHTAFRGFIAAIGALAFGLWFAGHFDVLQEMD
ncbi:MAG: hypothetical protein WAU60_10930 [Candidatus Competibacter denitrificans]|jgi:hypothetical protein